MVEGSFEHSNKPSGSKKLRDFSS